MQRELADAIIEELDALAFAMSEETQIPESGPYNPYLTFDEPLDARDLHDLIMVAEGHPEVDIYVYALNDRVRVVFRTEEDEEDEGTAA